MQKTKKNQAKKTDDVTADSSSAEDEDVEVTDEATDDDGVDTQEPANDEPGKDTPEAKRPSVVDVSDDELVKQAQLMGLVKSVSLNEVIDAVRSTISKVFERINDNRYDGGWSWYSDLLVYPDNTAVLCADRQHWRFTFSLEDGYAVIPPMSEWVKVEQEWVEANAQKAVDLAVEDTVVAFGTEVKFFDDHKIGGYLVRFTDPNNPDLVGDYFDAKTDFGFHRESESYWDHGQDGVMRRTSILKPGSMKAKLTIDEVGVWIEGVLDDQNRYMMAVERLHKAGKMVASWSSGTAPHLVERVPVPTKSGVNYIAKWPLGLDASLTVRPAAGPDLTKAVPLKSLTQTAVPSLKSMLEEADKLPSEDDMSLTIEQITAAMTGVVTKAIAPIEARLDQSEKTLAELKAAPADNKLPVGGGDAPTDAAKDSTKAVLAAAYVSKFHDENTALKQVYLEASGQTSEAALGDFLVDQTEAFAKYVRMGSDFLTGRQQELLQKQVFPPSVLKSLAENGYSVAAIKESQMIAQGRLGGYAVPPNIQQGIISRLPGMTIVRANGAKVLTLVDGAMGVDIILDDGGDSQYPSGYRGNWGSEHATATATNTTFRNIMTMVNPYQFKVTISTMMLQSVATIVSFLEDKITETAAQDEDKAFLTGTGTGGQPLGILPDAVNTLGIQEVSSATGGSGTIDPDKLIELLDNTIDEQYSENTILALSKGTMTALRKIKDAEDRYMIADGLGTGPRQTNIRGVPFKRSQHVPDIAVNAYPLIYGNMAAYIIVELPGLTIRRMQDSGTGLNKVEFHVQRFLTGRVYEKYKLAVMKTT